MAPPLTSDLSIVLSSRLCSTVNLWSPVFSIFSVSLKSRPFYIKDQWVGRVHSKECYFIITYTFLDLFFVLVFVFHQKNVFSSFSFLFRWIIEFSQQNINQIETVWECWEFDDMSLESYLWKLKSKKGTCFFLYKYYFMEFNFGGDLF